MGSGKRSSAVGMGGPWVPITMMIGAACSYGVISTVLKLAYRHGFLTVEVTSAQYDIACVMVWLVAACWRSNKTVRGRQLPLLACIGLLGAGTSYAYYFALTRLPASLAIVLLFQFTWMVPVMDMIVHRHWLRRRQTAGVVLILVGTVLAVGLGRHGSSGFSLWGVMLGLASGLCYGLQLFLAGYMDDESSPALQSALMVTTSAIVATAVSWPKWIWNGRLWHGLWLWGGLAALFAQVIPMLLIAMSIPRIGGRMAGVFGAAELPTAVVFAAVLLGERVTAEQWAGSAIILLGIVVSEWLDFKPKNGLNREVTENE